MQDRFKSEQLEFDWIQWLAVQMVVSQKYMFNTLWCRWGNYIITLSRNDVHGKHDYFTSGI
jgi:hypothetical protein